jgi:hypothetical protein
LLLMVLALIYPLVVVAAARHPQLSTLFGLGYAFALTALTPGLFLVVGARQSGKNWLRQLPRILLVTVFGSGLMVNTGRAVLQIFTDRNPEFERTAKFGIEADATGKPRGRASDISSTSTELCWSRWRWVRTVCSQRGLRISTATGAFSRMRSSSALVCL